MGIEIVLDMAVSAMADRVAVGRRDSGLTYRQLDDMAAGGAGLLRDRGVEHLVFVGVNGPIIPVLMFAAAKAGIPLAPMNYRLPSDQMRALIAQLDRPMIVTDSAYRADLEGASEHVLTSDEFVATARGPDGSITHRRPTTAPRSCWSPQGRRRPPRGGCAGITSGRPICSTQSNSALPVTKRPC